jgi:ferritin-like metal-binding protein YciE
MPMQTPKDLFMHELGDIYDAENRILQILPQLAQECDNQQVRSTFQQHEQETRQQIQNIEQVYQLLGTQPKREPCMAVQGLKQEHDMFLQESPSQSLLTMFDVDTGEKTEYYEMASYQGLIEQCNLMSQQQCAQLLQQNFQQEQAMAQRLQTLGKQLSQQAISHMGQMNQMNQMSQMNQMNQMGQQPLPSI